MREMQEMGEDFIFLGTSPNILGNAARHSGKCRQTFRGMFSNIPGNLLRHSGEFTVNTTGNVAKHSGECPQTIQRILENILRRVVKIMSKVLKHSDECT